MTLLPCALVHHTGSMIRFRPRQLGDLPRGDRDLQIILPSGRLVGGHFRRNEANPNVSGRELVAYIKRRLRFGVGSRQLAGTHSPRDEEDAFSDYNSLIADLRREAPGAARGPPPRRSTGVNQPGGSSPRVSPQSLRA